EEIARMFSARSHHPLTHSRILLWTYLPAVSRSGRTGVFRRKQKEGAAPRVTRGVVVFPDPPFPSHLERVHAYHCPTGAVRARTRRIRCTAAMVCAGGGTGRLSRAEAIPPRTSCPAAAPGRLGTSGRWTR